MSKSNYDKFLSIANRFLSYASNKPEVIITIAEGPKIIPNTSMIINNFDYD